jgi:hypothetical protein
MKIIDQSIEIAAPFEVAAVDVHCRIGNLNAND